MILLILILLALTVHNTICLRRLFKSLNRKYDEFLKLKKEDEE